MRKLSLLLGIVFSTHLLIAQQYNTAVGVKGDWSTLNYDLAQISVKHFFNSPYAIEANLGFGVQYLWLEGVCHRNMPLKGDVEWYAGGGADVGYWFTKNVRADNPNPHQGVWTGTTALVGLEFTTNVIPLNFALDAGPTFRFTPTPQIGLKVGFAARYAFK